MHKNMKPGIVRTLFAVALLAGSLVFATQGVGSASAQVTDPYATTTTTRPTPSSQPPQNCDRTPNRPGCQTTTTVGQTTTTLQGCRPLIEISLSSAPPGVQVIVSVDLRCFPPGTLITFTFNRQPIGTSVVQPDGSAALGGSGFAALSPGDLVAQVRQLFGAEVAQSADNDASARFEVPSVRPGTYPVCAVSAVTEPVCTNLTVTGAGGGRGSLTGSGSGSGSGSLTGAFGRSGLALLPWLAAAAAAITLGLGLKRPGRLLRRRTT